MAEKSLEELKEYLELQGKSLQTRAQEKVQIAEQIAMERKLNDEASKGKDWAAGKLKSLHLLGEQRLAELEAAENLHELELKSIKAAADQSGHLDASLKKRYEELQVEKKKLQIQKKALQNARQVGSEFSSLITNLTGIGAPTGFMGSIMGATDTMDGLKVATGQMVSGFTNAINPTTLFASTLAKVAQSTMALAVKQDDALANVSKMTSTSTEFNATLMEVEKSNREFGISTENAGSALLSLRSGMTSFSLVNEETQKSLVESTARFEKLGVAAEDSAKVFDTATDVLGFSRGRALDLEKELATAAVQLKMHMGEVVAGFNQAMPILARYGSEAPKIFLKVQSAARSLGIETQRLLDIVGQFDTFEGAAQAAGKLNAILGGNLLNSTELLLATEDERVRMIKDSIDASGRQWKSMNRFERMAIANTLGITDMNEATKLMTKSVDRFGDASGASAIKTEEMEKRINAARGVTEKLADTWRLFAISMRTPVKWLHTLISKVYEWNKAVGGYMVPILTVLAGALWTYTKVMRFRAAAEAKAAAGSNAFVDILKNLTGSEAVQSATTATSTALTEAQTVARQQQILVNRTLAETNRDLARSQQQVTPSPDKVKIILAYGAAILMIGVGVGIAAAGIGYLASQMKGMGAESLALVLVVGTLAGAFYVMIPALATAAAGAHVAWPPLLALGGAIALIGLGIGIAAVGIGFMAGQMKGMGLESIALIVIVGILAIAMVKMAALGSLAGAGLTVFAVGVGALGAALLLLSTDKLEHMASLMGSIQKMTLSAGEGTRHAGEGMKMIAESADNFDAENVKRITEVFNTVTERRVENTAGPAAPAAPVRPIEIHTTVEMDKDTFGEAVLQVVKNSPEFKKAFAGG